MFETGLLGTVGLLSDKGGTVEEIRKSILLLAAEAFSGFFATPWGNRD